MKVTKVGDRARESRAAIERLYIAMRHLLIRGEYKPLGVSGTSIIDALMVLRPEIYGSITDPERVELDGLLYVAQRLPRGIESCRFVRLISKEGYEKSNFETIIPSKRRRQCYRIDQEQILIEMTKGRSDIYDILTHLTFMYIEAEKIRKNSLNTKGQTTREWSMLEEIVRKESENMEFDKEVAYAYLSTILGRTYIETREACLQFENTPDVNSLFHFIYWLGQKSMDEATKELDREISFSSVLREEIGHHTHGELWASNIKAFLSEKGLIDRPLHIISANLHSVMNIFFGESALKKEYHGAGLDELAKLLSMPENGDLRDKVEAHALRHGMYFLNDSTGMDIDVQVFDTARIDFNQLPEGIKLKAEIDTQEKPVLLVMNYAFGEQAYEVMDELFKPYENGAQKVALKVISIAIMGKAGILEGEKGDIMIPNAHVFEGTADNYPFKNEFSKATFEGHDLKVFDNGPMITVLGTSLQNKDILKYFNRSSWRAIGLEMEGAHYQKAIQSASQIRKSISKDVKLMYAYYASDNPLVSGQTLASGSLGIDGVKPTYLITLKILQQIFNPA